MNRFIVNVCPLLCGTLCLCRPILFCFIAANCCYCLTFISEHQLLLRPFVGWSLCFQWSCIFSPFLLLWHLCGTVGVNWVSSVHLLIKLQHTYSQPANQCLPIWFAVIVIAVISDLPLYKLSTLVVYKRSKSQVIWSLTHSTWRSLQCINQLKVWTAFQTKQTHSLNEFWRCRCCADEKYH